MIHWNALRLAVVILVGLAAGCGKEDPFAALSPEDAKLAKAQEVCPVSDKKLGDMGTPIKVQLYWGEPIIRSRAVFLCSEMCIEKILDDPDKYLAKLDKKGETVLALIAALKDEDVEVRWHAADALGGIGPAAKEAVPALIADAEGSPVWPSLRSPR